MAEDIKDFISFKSNRGREQEKGELPALPTLSFGFETDEKNLPFQADLERSRQQLEAAWRDIEPSVLTAFEEVTHGKWHEEYRKKGIPVLLRAHDGNKARWFKPMLLDIRERPVPYAQQRGIVGMVRDTTSLLEPLTHELSHYFATKQDIDYVEDNFAKRIDRKHLGKSDYEAIRTVCAEVQAEVVWKATIDRCFLKETVNELVERRRGSHKGVYELIDTLSEDEKNQIIDRDRRKYAHFAPKRFLKDRYPMYRMLPPYTHKR